MLKLFERPQFRIKFYFAVLLISLELVIFTTYLLLNYMW